VNLNDPAVISKLKSGDAAAFEELYDEMSTRWRNYFTNERGKYKFTPQEAEDITQQAFLNIYKNILKFDVQGPAKFTTWIYMIAKNIAADLQRDKNKQGRLIDPDSIPSTQPTHPDDENSHQNDSSSAREKDPGRRMKGKSPIVRAFNSLKRPRRAILRLRVLDGLTHDVVAEKLGKKAGAVRALFHHAAKQLKELYKIEEAKTRSKKK
jgi:RNA polymerase sigma-70 factor (ECF subfamily)